MSDLTFRRVQLREGIRDVVVRDGLIAEITDDAPSLGSVVIDGRGGALLPGLHDHHLHVYATAAAAASVRCGPPAVTDLDGLAAALAVAPGDGWIRGVGYAESVGGLLDRSGLDRCAPDRPVRIQHRSGALWILNTRAAELTGLEHASHPGIERDDAGRPTGRLWRADDWLRQRLPDAGLPPLSVLGERLCAYGITGITDATPDLSRSSREALIAAHHRRELPQRLHLLGVGVDDHLPGAGPTVTVGPYKIVIADSGLPDLADLTDRIRRAHTHSRPVAVHCVSRVALALLLAAFRDVGVMDGDRIEHGAIIGAATLTDLAQLGVRVVTQPGFLADRGDDYLARVDTADLADLYRCRSLLDHDVRTALSSDAPYGPLDPWEVIRAATERRAPTGAIIGASERVTAAQALDCYLAALDDPGGPPRQIHPGPHADLVLLDRPLDHVLADSRSTAVRCTVVGGELRWRQRGAPRPHV